MVDLRRTELTVRAERAILVQIYSKRNEELARASLEELRALAGNAHAIVVGELAQPRLRPDPHTYVGKGKVAELGGLCRELDADIVICDDDLKPSQVRKLEETLDTKVVDRSEVILDIFAQHARTHQARLQVELAQLEYAFPRLKKMWTHLDRLAGGTVGGLGGIGVRGPGEKQLEVDRRLVERRIQDLKEELGQVENRRRIEAADRTKKFSTVSIVGYTNAGKSTLMNALTDAGVSVRDRLFETLDTRTRRWALPDGRGVMLSDTVGFIRKLPHHLVASFHATLEEARTADVLLHVADAASPTAEAQIAAVEGVLKDVGCTPDQYVLVLNKVDVIEDDARLLLLRRKAEHAVCVSALTGQGLDQLAALVQQFLDHLAAEVTIEMSVGNGKLISLLYEKGVVLDRVFLDGVARFKVKVPQQMVGSIKSLGGRIRQS